MYKMQLPESKTIETSKIAGIFLNVTNSYKYYFFIAILYILQKRACSDQTLALKGCKIEAKEIASTMLGLAWHAKTVYNLNFGKQDTLSAKIDILKVTLDIKEHLSSQAVIEQIRGSKDLPAIKKLLKDLLKYVPVKFLSPWTGSRKDTGPENLEIGRLSCSPIINAPYRLNLNDGGTICLSIELYAHYCEYFLTNYPILMDFSYYNLAQYLQRLNLCTPNLLQKIIYQKDRDSMTAQRAIFTRFMQYHKSLQCIYTQKTLDINNFALDHFMPWSFVAHNQIWNLIPVEQSINSIKSNRIPNLDLYLKDFAKVHHALIKDFEDHKFKGLNTANLETMKSYNTLGYSSKELSLMDDRSFYDTMFSVMKPLSVQALYSGFNLFG